MQLIDKGLATGEGFSGGSEYTGSTGIAHAYLHMHVTLCRQEQLSHHLQGHAAAFKCLLSKATVMVDAARASPQVQNSDSKAPIHIPYAHGEQNLHCLCHQFCANCYCADILQISAAQ